MGTAPGSELGSCSHDCFHTVTMQYDRAAAQLVSYRTCDGCGTLLAELGRQHYRPRFDRSGAAKAYARAEGELGNAAVSAL